MNNCSINNHKPKKVTNLLSIVILKTFALAYKIHVLYHAIYDDKHDENAWWHDA
jgi:hypothetical protein